MGGGFIKPPPECSMVETAVSYIVLQRHTLKYKYMYVHVCYCKHHEKKNFISQYTVFNSCGHIFPLICFLSV